MIAHHLLQALLFILGLIFGLAAFRAKVNIYTRISFGLMMVASFYRIFMPDDWFFFALIVLIAMFTCADLFFPVRKPTPGRSRRPA